MEEIVPEVERLLRESAPAGAEVEVDLWSAAPPGLIPPDSAAIRLGQDAFERALGVRPLLLRSGGTLPIVPALADKGIPTIVTGFDLPEGNLHSPNERLLVEHVPLGVAAAQELFRSLAGLRLGVPVMRVVHEPVVAEAAHLLDHRQQADALRRELVLDPRRRLRVAVPGEDAFLLQPAQPLRERARADAGAGVLELGEPARALRTCRGRAAPSTSSR